MSDDQQSQPPPAQKDEAEEKPAAAPVTNDPMTTAVAAAPHDDSDVVLEAKDILEIMEYEESQEADADALLGGLNDSVCTYLEVRTEFMFKRTGPLTRAARVNQIVPTSSEQLGTWRPSCSGTVIRAARYQLLALSEQLGTCCSNCSGTYIRAARYRLPLSIGTMVTSRPGPYIRATPS